MNPIGLTQAEEASQQPTNNSAASVKAAPGEPSCRITVPPDGEACGAVVERRIVWSDGEMTLTCADCAGRMNQLAQSHHTILRVETLAPPPKRENLIDD